MSQIPDRVQVDYRIIWKVPGQRGSLLTSRGNNLMVLMARMGRGDMTNLDWVEQATGQAGPSPCERLGHSWREGDVRSLMPSPDMEPADDLRVKVCRVCQEERWWVDHGEGK